MLFEETKFAKGVILLSDFLGVNKQLHFPHSPYQMVKHSAGHPCVYIYIYLCVCGVCISHMHVCVYVVPFGYVLNVQKKQLPVSNLEGSVVGVGWAWA